MLSFQIKAIFTRLWVRLSLAFAAVVLIGVMMTTLIGLLVYTEGVQDLDMAAAFSDPGGPVETTRNFLQTSPSGVGLDLILAGVQSAYPQDDAITITFRYTTQDGRVLFDGHPTDQSDWTVDRFDGDFPIMIDGEPHGTLNILRLTAYEDWDPQNAFFGWLRQDFGLVAVIGAGIGIVAGIMISRSVSAPLRALSQAADALAARDYTTHVQPSGSAEMVHLAQAFNHMAAEISESEMRRRNLVADVAHELRTPLTVLQGSLRAILDDVYTLDKQEVASLYDQTRVLGRLVNDLHELAQAEARQLPLNVQTFDLVPMVERITATFGAVCEDASVQLTRYLPPRSLMVSGDAARLSQVINNLLNNALQHTPAGGTITVRLWQSGDTLRLAVEDTGRGIAPEHLPHLFERFYRADRARRRDTGGVGLGLAIVKAIVEGHGGQVCAESAGVNLGATIWFQLPLRADTD